MAAISSISIGSVAICKTHSSLNRKDMGSQVSLFKSFSGFKASASVNIEAGVSFLGSGSNATVWDSFKPKPSRLKMRCQNQFQTQASYKVVILGAAGGIGQPLSLLIKMSPLVSALYLYDIANVKGVAALSH